MLWIQILISAIDESQTKLRYCSKIGGSAASNQVEVGQS